jgi:hypothetical protein
MTIRVDIAAQDAMAELVAHLRAGEDVELVSEGDVVAIANPPPPEVRAPRKGRRTLGAWKHLNLNLPDDLFIGPDPEIEAEMDNPIFPKD